LKYNKRKSTSDTVDFKEKYGQTITRISCRWHPHSSWPINETSSGN